MDKIWERSLGERRKAQRYSLRDFIIGQYAPREPMLMENIHRFLLIERKIPLGIVHRIIDRFASMTISTTVMTHEEVMRFIESIPEDFAIARGPCACRLHTAEAFGPDAVDLAAGQYERCRQSPLDVDIQIAACGEQFGKLDTYRRISKDELLALEKECFNLGLVANVYVLLGGEAGICHCSSSTCVPFLANQAIGGRSNVLKKGKLLARTDSSACNGTGNCVKVCHFQARALRKKLDRQVAVVDPSKCYGCGLCQAVCLEKAVSLVPRQ